MKNTVLLCAVLAISLLFTNKAVALPFNNNLTKEQLKSLNEGKLILRSIDSASKMCIDSTNDGAKKILQEIKNLSPSYLAEVIQIRPYKGNEDLPTKLEDALTNISDYVGIPYYSEQNNIYVDLYSDAKIKNDSLSEDGITREIKADLTMVPFGVIETSIKVHSSKNYIYYVSTNDSQLLYNGKIKCVKPENMKSAILLFRDGDNWILYGAGGVKAAKVIFLAKRIETSFINRIKTFCNFIFDKL